MPVTIKEVSSKKELRKYIYLPAKIHKDHKNWVPPLYMDEWEYYNPKKNVSFSYCDTILLLAYRGDEIVGRIMGVINHKYNEKKNEKNGRWNYLETWEDQEVAHELLSYVENWAREKGMIKIIGPFSFSEKDPQGFLTQGFDETVNIASICNFKYLTEIVEKEGYSKEIDLVVYKVDIPEVMPEFYIRICERTQRNNPDLRMLEFTKRRKLKPYVRPILTLLNNTFQDIYGFAALTTKEMDEFANRYLMLINPRFVKAIVTPDNNPVAFVIGMADISKGIQKCGGHLLPFGIFNLFSAAKKTKQITLLLGGIDPAYRGRGLDTWMGVKMFESGRHENKEYFDSHCELETNKNIRAEMERMGGKVYKTYRIYQKSLVN
ncbi:hypothetical protein ACFLSI_00765 [Bacteroidota bacterium]